MSSIDLETEISHLTVFETPATIVVSGPSGVGKTEFVIDVVINNKEYFKPNVEHIVYCYNNWQISYDKIKLVQNLKFNEGLPNTNEILSNTLLVIDDLYTEAEQNQEILDLFIRESHHRNITVILITQNLYSRTCKNNFRTMRINSHYIIYFDSPADRTPIYTLSRQMYPHCTQFLVECFFDAINNGSNYLYIKTKPRYQKYRIMRGILKGEKKIVYIL